MDKKQKVLRGIQHKITMCLYSQEKHALGTSTISNEQALKLARLANKVAEKIFPEYLSKDGAGALWLDRLIKSDEISDYL